MHQIVNYKYLLLVISMFTYVSFFSCRKNEDFSDSSYDRLYFEIDTVHFDTVFTTIGSITKQFKFYNKNDKAVRTTISLGGDKSYYRLNIDGKSTNRIEDYEIMAHDSIFVLVEVNVDPQNSDNPMVINDSIMFYTNGNKQNVKLVAYGQDVNLLSGSIIGSQTWKSGKPYLIYNSIIIDKDETLSIEEGVEIYFHNESAMWVYGTLDVQGTSASPVVFKGDRSGSWYEYTPGQWYGYYRSEGVEYLTGGIHFWKGSRDNIINYAIVKNGVKGIQVDYKDDNSKNPTLILSNSIVKNMSAVGLVAQNTNVLVSNTVIANCGYNAVVLSLGGNYEFYHSTIGNYYEFDSRKTPSLVFNNYNSVNGQVTEFYFNAKFGNSIVYGTLDNEFVVDFYSSDINKGNFVFDHCMIKLNDDFDTSNKEQYKNIIRDRDMLPKFINTYEGDFRLDTLSDAKDRGGIDYSLLYPTDQDGESRVGDGKPDLGAYERIE